jgi:hypothetical protein
MHVLGIGPESGIALAKGIQLRASAGRVANRAWSIRLACPMFLGPEQRRDGERAEKHDRENLEDFEQSILQRTGTCMRALAEPCTLQS